MSAASDTARLAMPVSSTRPCPKVENATNPGVGKTSRIGWVGNGFATCMAAHVGMILCRS